MFGFGFGILRFLFFWAFVHKLQGDRSAVISRGVCLCFPLSFGRWFICLKNFDTLLAVVLMKFSIVKCFMQVVLLMLHQVCFYILILTSTNNVVRC